MTSFFSFRLFKESLRRLRTVGTTAFLLTFFGSVLSPASLLADTLFFDLDSKSVQIIEAPIFALPLMVLLLLSPLFVFTTLSFLNRRSHSDFYHALPYTRLSLFVHFMLGTVAWQGAIIAVSMGVRAILYAVNPYTLFSFSAVLLGIAVYSVAILLYTGLAALACSASGNLLAALFSFSTLALFMPAVGHAIKQLIATVFPIIDTSGGLLASLGWQTFWPLPLFLSALGGANPFTRVPMILLSAVMACVSFVLAGWIFCRRRSENAGFSTGEPVFNYAVGNAFALVVGVGILFRQSMEWLGVLVMLGAYLVYQLITLRRRSKFLRALKWCFIAPAVALLILLSVYGWRSHFLRHIPTGEQISSVVLTGEENSYVDWLEWGEIHTYEQLMLAETRIEDPEVLALVAEALSDNARLMKDGKLFEYGIIEEDYYPFPLRLTVRQRGSTPKYYSLYFTQDAYLLLQEALAEDSDYMDAYAKLPADSELVGVLSSFTDQDLKKDVWKVFCEEYATLTPAQQKQVKDLSVPDACRLLVKGSVGGESFESQYSVPPFMPRTLAALISKVNSETVRLLDGELYRSDDALRQILADPHASTYSDLSITVNSIGSVYLYYYTDRNEANWQSLVDSLRVSMAEQVSPTDDPSVQVVFLTVRAMRYEQEQLHSVTFSVVLTVSADGAQELLGLYK